eukprot:TRINITY_DN66087_c0_g1_i1.p1 TRINITY_DN66087_c0_g1~~TRINITY_DN66087_c0_g1_i1.p1  ORF type:complete len:164 (-),score=41.29 TRINITY_DN66087_c0_g1_i1:137-628(-)
MGEASLSGKQQEFKPSAIFGYCCRVASRCCTRTSALVKECSPFSAKDPPSGDTLIEEEVAYPNLLTSTQEKPKRKKPKKQDSEREFAAIAPGSGTSAVSNPEPEEDREIYNLLGRRGSLSVGDAFDDLLDWAADLPDDQASKDEADGSAIRLGHPRVHWMESL